MTDEEFEQHYTKIHIPMVAEILVRHNVLQYSVVSSSRMSSVDGMEKIQALFNNAVESIDCDAVVTTIFPDMNALEATFADPDLPAKLHPDEKNFTEDDRRMVIGKEYFGVRDGKRVD
ncbi:EthD domain-containing protein [Trichoderma simmonsii]|uniref:EthD domain-containing protein n=1 Tax=Trichoderma simmonsii TaxID=1491479 RepID=A0A8G0LSX3_9HYPO|nr:EthD domain-containing protein [Trichoderma simmonsii]